MRHSLYNKGWLANPINISNPNIYNLIRTCFYTMSCCQNFIWSNNNSRTKSFSMFTFAIFKFNNDFYCFSDCFFSTWVIRRECTGWKCDITAVNSVNSFFIRFPFSSIDIPSTPDYLRAHALCTYTLQKQLIVLSHRSTLLLHGDVHTLQHGMIHLISTLLENVLLLDVLTSAELTIFE